MNLYALMFYNEINFRFPNNLTQGSPCVRSSSLLLRCHWAHPRPIVGRWHPQRAWQNTAPAGDECQSSRAQSSPLPPVPASQSGMGWMEWIVKLLLPFCFFCFVSAAIIQIKNEKTSKNEVKCDIKLPVKTETYPSILHSVAVLQVLQLNLTTYSGKGNAWVLTVDSWQFLFWVVWFQISDFSFIWSPATLNQFRSYL